MWLNFKSMPVVLKFLTFHALACCFFLVGSIVPHNSFSMDGKTVSYAVWWSLGVGAVASVIGIILPLAGFLLLKKYSYARPTYIAALVIAFISPAGFVSFSNYGFDYYAPSFVLVLAISAYLYFRKPVKEYFAST